MEINVTEIDAKIAMYSFHSPTNVRMLSIGARRMNAVIRHPVTMPMSRVTDMVMCPSLR